MNDFRCTSCHKLLGKYRGCEFLEIRCPRCGTLNVVHSDKGQDAKLSKSSR